MSSEDEKAAIQARLYNCIKEKEPGWQEEGEPYLGSNVSGSDFETHFYRCTGDNKDEKCEDMAFSPPPRWTA